MSFAKRYIKGHIHSIAGLLGICCIFAVSFFAYKLPAGAVVYPSILSFVLMAYLMLHGMKKEKERHDIVQNAMLTRELINETMLPPALTIIEDDYRELVRILQKERVSAITSVNEKYDKLSEYYTLWAHQIKTPIASMKLKLAGVDNETARAVASDLLRIEQYVDMVMTYVRLDSQTTDYQFREYDIDSIIRQNIRKFSSDFISKKLSLSYEPAHIRVLTDEKWLGFVIEQLLSNSVKYTQQGGVTVAVSEDDDTVTLSLSDTGIGISDENLPRLFDLGFTGYNGRTNNRASGIGLYLCKRICDNLGADIAFSSAVGEGTTVTLTFKKNVTRL